MGTELRLAPHMLTPRPLLFYVWGPFGLSVFLAKDSFKSSGRTPWNLGKLVVYCKVFLVTQKVI